MLIPFLSSPHAQTDKANEIILLIFPSSKVISSHRICETSPTKSFEVLLGTVSLRQICAMSVEFNFCVSAGCLGIRRLS